MSNREFCGLKNFEAYLASGRAPCWTMDVSDIHGFFTGLAMAGPVPEEAWMPMIWSGERPQFATPEEARIVLAELRRFHDNVSRDVVQSGNPLVPLLLADASGGHYASLWAEGFLQAIELNPDPWRQVMEVAPDSVEAVLHSCFANQDQYNTGVITDDEQDAMIAHLRQLLAIMVPSNGADRHSRRVA